ncbi:helix-turn-helix domain-containing protein [Paenibacillus sp. WLX2291]|uniref:AraC family transcriptional regulator n=1 Tax=Paenibacillus sp. WLX2291 TaxID=3296934 RepID=UPI003983F17F
MSKPLFEHIAYPDDSFPYIMYTHTTHNSIPEGRGFNDLHWHDELQITLATRGKLIIQVNGIDHHLEQGQAILINKGILHIATYLEHDGQYASFNFPEKLLSFYGDSVMEKNYVTPYTNSSLVSLDIRGDHDWEHAILDMLWEMKRTFEIAGASWGWQYEVSIKTLQLWFTLISHIPLSTEQLPKHAKQQQERLQLMLSYIHQHFVDPITLQQIADIAHLSVSECTRSFRKTIHMTPYDYLIKYRLKKSCDLLLSTDDTITEVAQRVGFNHVNHFIQSFKKAYEQTPKEYRKARLQQAHSQ